ncbi:MAG: AsmA family protein, partial [Terriglobia bacterium]
MLAKIVQKAEQATGSRVTIGDFTFRWAGLHADIYRITLDGAGENYGEPLFTADHLGVGLKIISILGRKVRLNSMTLDHPTIHILVDERGKTNIPAPKNSSQSTKPVNVFNLAAGLVRINQGEIYYQNARLPLDASCRNLQVQVRFDTLKTAYDGTLSYKEGMVHFGNFRPLQHNLEAKFSAEPSELTVDQVLVASGASHISAQARLTDYLNPSVSGTYRMIVSGRQLQDVLKNRTLPTGQIITSGSLHYQRVRGQPLLRSLTVDGQLNSSRLDLNIPQAHSVFQAVRSRYRFADGNLIVKGLEADGLGGHLTADMAMQHVAATPNSRITGSFHDISLTAVNAALSSKPLRDVPLQGRADGSLAATWQGRISRAKIHSDITITADSLPLKTGLAQTSATMKIPVDGVLHCTYDAGQNALSLSQSYLRTPHLKVQVNGTLGPQSQMSVNATTDSLHEVDVLVLGIRSNTAPQQASSAPAQLLGLEGAGSFAGQILGSVKDPRFAGQVVARNVQFRDEHVPLARSQITLGRSQLRLAQGNLTTGGGGSIRFDAAVGLNDWRYSPLSPIAIQAAVNRIQLADLERLTSLQY